MLSLYLWKSKLGHCSSGCSSKCKPNSNLTVGTKKILKFELWFCLSSTTEVTNFLFIALNITCSP